MVISMPAEGGKNWEKPLKIKICRSPISRLSEYRTAFFYPLLCSMIDIFT